MRSCLLALPIPPAQAPTASAQIAVGIGMEMPGVSIRINLPIAPELQRVPGYPVYCAPQADANHTFYGGKAYFNLHRSFATGGEIRGILAPIPEPGT